MCSINKMLVVDLLFVLCVGSWYQEEFLSELSDRDDRTTRIVSFCPARLFANRKLFRRVFVFFFVALLR